MHFFPVCLDIFHTEVIFQKYGENYSLLAKVIYKQAGAELGQAQVKLDDIVVVVLEVVVKAMVEVEFQLLFRVDGGWSDKTKLILISTLVEVVVEVEVELGNIFVPEPSVPPPLKIFVGKIIIQKACL